MQIILRLRESGVIIWHLRDVIRRRDNYNLREVTVEHDRYDGSIKVLGLMPLGAGFFLLFIGSLTASLTFYLELRRAAKATSVHDLLRNISKKRSFNQSRTRFETNE